MVAAGYLRMCFPGLGWFYLPTLLHGPPRILFGAILGAPPLEILVGSLFYLLAAVLYQLIARMIFPNDRHQLTYLLLGCLPSTLWLVASLANERMAKHCLSYLVVYGLTGLLYGFLYHRHFVKNRPVPE